VVEEVHTETLVLNQVVLEDQVAEVVEKELAVMLQQEQQILAAEAADQEATAHTEVQVQAQLEDLDLL
jgi:hypothetical protein